MVRIGRFSNAGAGLGSWPVLLIMALGVLTPSATLLWFMNRAVENERLAVRQRLVEAYEVQLNLRAARAGEFFHHRAEELRAEAEHKSAPELFEWVVTRELADGFAMQREDGQWAYPSLPEMLPSAGSLPEPDASRQAAFLQSAARDALVAGKTNEALETWIRLGEPEFATALDPRGRSIAAASDLAALELLSRDDPRFAEVSRRLRQRLNYSNAQMTSPERRFLAREWLARNSDPELARLLEAEEFTEHSLQAFTNIADRVQQLANGTVVFQTNRMVLIFRAPRLKSALAATLLQPQPDAGMQIEVLDHAPASGLYLATAPLPELPGWRIAARLRNPAEWDAAAQRQVSVYLWIGLLMVTAITIMGILAARALMREMRLARLKNDLLASVTHELKTPLASTRLLVDTLLEAPHVSDPMTREYLEMIARENRRLGSLIENFLAFSRMERNKFSLDCAAVSPARIVRQAAEAVREKFALDGCEFIVECADDLPDVRADADSLATALINLLENAFKYSGSSKRIRLAARCRDGRVLFQVEDNGIGIRSSELKKIFRRFYQVDRSLSRSAGGCGLGLSIVEFIVRAHAAEITVESQAGRGSTFTISMPPIRAEKLETVTA